MKDTPRLSRASGTRLLLASALAGLVSAASGCSFSTLTTASNMTEGESQFIVAPGVTRYQRSGGEPLWVPQVELGGRYALSDQVEVGGKVWLPGVQLDCKVGLVGVDDAQQGSSSRFHVALDPTVGYLGGFSGTPDGGNVLHILTFGLPVLLGWEFGPHELVVAPRIVDEIWTGSGADDMTANIVSLGTSVGFSWQPLPGFRVIPEVSLGVIVLQTLSDFGSHVGPNGSIFQANLAFVFGG